MHPAAEIRSRPGIEASIPAAHDIDEIHLSLRPRGKRIGDPRERGNIQRFAADRRRKAAAGQKLGKRFLGKLPQAGGKRVEKRFPTLAKGGLHNAETTFSLVISQTSSVRTFSRSTAEVTFGCGMKQDGGTSNSSSGTA